jgi:alpha-glucuronidase
MNFTPFRRRLLPMLILAGWLGFPALVHAEDGYKLWLRYDQIEDQDRRSEYESAVRQIVVQEDSETGEAIREELKEGLSGLIGTPPSFASTLGSGSVLVGTPDGSPLVKSLAWDADLAQAGPEGYIIREAVVQGESVLVIASLGKFGLLHGTFHFLRLLQTNQPLAKLNLIENPKIQLRLLNHWDNINGSVERGYAGSSIWKWAELPGTVDRRYRDYARANASIGINGTVLNNVNPQPEQLTEEYLKKSAALAKVFRPYGIKIYFCILFDSPITLGGLATADPLAPEVQAWWKAKADEIYSIIPDFGGFLIKADSEGRPGPNKYRRTHAEGANMLGDALASHGGFLMWRCFVYDGGSPDRAKRAYDKFRPLDGQFRPNVFLQVKYGPIDFQPREMFHPLFGGMPKTPLATELQITQENTGHSTHLVYLGSLWQDFFSTDTYANGPGSTIATLVEKGPISCVAGVSNVGSDRNWTGHDFAQANWYAFGRFAWDPTGKADQFAEEWIRMTWSNDSKVIETLGAMMRGSWEAMVDYEMPIGLTHIMEGGSHYGPSPKEFQTMHNADAEGIGYDRSSKGSNAVSQYAPEVARQYDALAACPDNLLLWFHHVPWDHKMQSGRTVWDELCFRYNAGVDYVKEMQAQWKSVRGKVDAQRFEAVKDKLAKQVKDSSIWRDTCIRYFQSKNGKALPSYLKNSSANNSE